MDPQPVAVAPRRWLTPVVVIGALVVLLLVGAGLKRRLLGPDPQTVVTSALQSMRAQNRLTPFVARYVSVVTTSQQQLGGLLTSQRTLILPGDVRYELDLAALRPDDVTWDAASSTLTVRLPDVALAGPDVDLANLREYGAGGLLSHLTDSATALDQANRARAVADLRQQAAGPLPMRLARDAARTAVEQSFALPLRAAGFAQARVVARFPSDGEPLNGEIIDHSRSYNEVLGESR